MTRLIKTTHEHSKTVEYNQEVQKTALYEKIVFSKIPE